MADERQRLKLKPPSKGESGKGSRTNRSSADEIDLRGPKRISEHEKFEQKRLIEGIVGKVIDDDEAEQSLSEQEMLNQSLIAYLKTTFLGKVLYEEDSKGEFIRGNYEVDAKTLARKFIPDNKSSEHKEVETITDVSFDGNNVYVQDNEYGRYRLNDPEKDPRIKQGMPPIKVEREDVIKLGKQVANRMGRAWNASDPIMDVEIGHLRSNFMYKVVAPYGVTMAIRVSRATLALRNVADMADQQVADLLETFMICGLNLLISGPTGTGKTEMQQRLKQVNTGYIE